MVAMARYNHRPPDPTHHDRLPYLQSSLDIYAC